jgi:hypothetical protein
VHPESICCTAACILAFDSASALNVIKIPKVTQMMAISWERLNSVLKKTRPTKKLTAKELDRATWRSVSKKIESRSTLRQILLFCNP